MGLNREGTTQSGGGGGLIRRERIRGDGLSCQMETLQRGGGTHYSCKMEDSSEGGAYQRERIMRDIRWGLIRGA